MSSLSLTDTLDALDQYLPPRVEAEPSYAHLFLETDLDAESNARVSSRKVLSCVSPRSPLGRKCQQLDLSIACTETWAKRGEGGRDDTVKLLGAANSSSSSSSSSSLSARVHSLCNNCDRVLLVLSERLCGLEAVARQRKRKANAPECRRLWARLLRDTHKFYTLLLATRVLLHNNVDEDVLQFQDFDYNAVLDEDDFAITLKMVQRWYCTGGKLDKAFQQLRAHFRSMRRQKLDMDECKQLSVGAFDKIDEASTRCLERIEALRGYLVRFDMQNAATAVLAAVRWRKINSPKHAAPALPLP